MSKMTEYILIIAASVTAMISMLCVFLTFTQLTSTWLDSHIASPKPGYRRRATL